MKKAFTLVELIVVITILAILGTIAFISLEGYSGEARDSKRLNDVNNIFKKISLERVKGVYPENLMVNGVDTSSGLILGGIIPTKSAQGTVNFSEIKEEENSFKDPKGNNYILSYAIGGSGTGAYKFVQLATINERKNEAVLVGDYYKLQTGDSESLIFSNSNDLNSALVEDKKGILPYNIYGSENVSSSCSQNYTWDGNSCVLNKYTISGSFGIDASGSVLDICGISELADSNGSFDVLRDYGSTCNNITATRNGYTCTTTTDGPSNLTNDILNIAGNCTLNSFVFTQTISSNLNNYDLRTSAISGGRDQIKPLDATITINSGVYIGSTSISNSALTVTGSFISGSSIVIINNGTIIGKGGSGGYGGTWNGGPGAGTQGGPGLTTSVNISVQNNGFIYGGGGGGGGGGGTADSSGLNYCIGGGGGGGGAGYGVAGNGQPCGGSYPGGNGSAGTVSTGGSWGIGKSNGSATSGHGGNGGAPGQAGGNGVNATGGYSPTGGAVGGAAGNAIVGNANITWLSNGTVLGGIIQ
ncbi:MAG: type II secretion system protein [Candidatus Gracilibacteria bacterium]|nr:type II secretion system protein [Candidatus Gracilibacteria bacterium]